MLIKICGLTLEKDALFAAKCGADLLGVVMSQTSPRRAAEKQARAILDLKIRQPKYLVFGYDDSDYIRHSFTALAQTGTRLQIMADHPQINELVKLAPTALIMPSISAAQKLKEADVARWAKHPLVLFDSHRGTQAGGTGIQFDYANLENIHRNFLLAGGLRPDNVTGVIKGVRNTPLDPFFLGLDTASGVEASPGIKDHKKLKAFIQNCRRVLARTADSK